MLKESHKHVMGTANKAFESIITRLCVQHELAELETVLRDII